MRRIGIIALGLFSLLTASPAEAVFRVSLKPEADTLRLGDALPLQLTLEPPAPGRLLPPDFSRDLEPFELSAPPDTSALRKTDGTPLQLNLKITSYEAGDQVLPPLTFVWISQDGVVQDTAETEPIILYVQGVVSDSVLAAADTTAKPVALLQPNRTKKLGYALSEFLPWILVLLAAAGGFLLVRYLRRHRKRKTGEDALPAPPRPAHELALEELDRLRDRRLFQSGRIKEYYSELSEIIRRYIEARFGIPALESTSFQLLRDIESEIRDGNLRGLLESLLEDADLAKFARHQPEEMTCQRDLEKGYVFVQKTKPAPQPVLAAVEETAP
jgi:hypothetical protein